MVGEGNAEGIEMIQRKGREAFTWVHGPRHLGWLLITWFGGSRSVVMRHEIIALKSRAHGEMAMELGLELGESTQLTGRSKSSKTS
jgi:hypothetical protein